MLQRPALLPSIWCVVECYSPAYAYLIYFLQVEYNITVLVQRLFCRFLLLNSCVYFLFCPFVHRPFCCVKNYGALDKLQQGHLSILAWNVRQTAMSNSQNWFTNMFGKVTARRRPGLCGHVLSCSLVASLDGFTKISKALDIPWNTVKTIINKLRKYGTTVAISRTGHPSKLDKTKRKMVLEAVKRSTATLRASSSVLC